MDGVPGGRAGPVGRTGGLAEAGWRLGLGGGRRGVDS